MTVASSSRFPGNQIATDTVLSSANTMAQGATLEEQLEAFLAPSTAPSDSILNDHQMNTSTLIPRSGGKMTALTNGETADVKQVVNALLHSSQVISAPSSSLHGSEFNNDTKTSATLTPLGQLVTDMQLLGVSISARLDAVAAETTSALPRIAHDLSVFGVKSSTLAQQYADFQTSLKGMSLPVVEELVTLSQIKARMEGVREALKEMEHWSSLPDEVETSFLAGDIESVVLRLRGAQASLALLKETPDYEAKRLVLEELQRRVVDYLVPVLTSTGTEENGYHESVVSSGDASGVFSALDPEKVLLMFQQIGREQDFFSAYFNQMAIPLINEYASLCTLVLTPHTMSDIASDSAEPSRAKSLPATPDTDAFSDAVEAFFQRAYRTISADSILPTVIPEFIPYLLRRLTPQFATLVASLQPRKRMRLFSALVHFGSRLESNYFTLIGKSPLPDWCAGLFGPFSPYQTATMILQSNLELVKLAHTPKLIDFQDHRVAADFVGDLFKEMDILFDDCYQFTFGLGLDALCGEADSYLSQQISRLECPPSSSTSDEASEMNMALLAYSIAILGLCKTVQQGMNTLSTKVASQIMRKPTAECMGALTLLQCLYKSEKAFVDPASIAVESAPASSPTKKSSSPIKSTASEAASPSAPSLASANLFSSSKMSMKSMIQANQNFVYHVLLDPIAAQFQYFTRPESGMKSSSSAASVNAADTVSNNGPLPYITKAGEFILSLPASLELYMDVDALGLAPHSLPYAQSEDMTMASTNVDLDADDIAYRWMTSVCRGAMHAFVQGILTLLRTTTNNTLLLLPQLATDIQYLINVLQAIDVDAIEELVQLDALCRCTGDDLRSGYAAWRADPTTQLVNPSLFKSDEISQVFLAMLT